MDLIRATPTKNFFVEMLTRDIDLKDAILDLLDNCIDGIQRVNRGEPESGIPYEGFWARITVSDKRFKIEDNCGGIPLEVAERYAFRMGKPEGIDDDDDIFTIGTYGIGMKRAIFKIGRSTQIVSSTVDNSFEVAITPEWLLSDDDWNLPLSLTNEKLAQFGTTIEISELREEVATQLSSTTFQSTLVNEVEDLYSYIISKGFDISINGLSIAPKPFALQWEGIEKLKNRDIESIAPYLYEAHRGDVDIELAIGFYRDLPELEELDAEESGKRSSNSADWTIICNDRVVVSHDKTRLTGWGEAGIPSYHPQFIAISGTVHFKSKDARKLPITTTKRGIDASSDLYLYVKDRMREGLKVFTSYTNRWKKAPGEEKKRTKEAKSEMPTLIFESVDALSRTPTLSAENGKSIWRDVKSQRFETERRYIPNLPSPPESSQAKRISFSKPINEVREVSNYIFEDTNRKPSDVGEACFSILLKKAQCDQ